MTQPVLILVGPTAVGKTDIAIALAQSLDAEIVSADSRQIYRYMDIGTAKPTAAQLAAVPHHFIDIKTPDEHYSAGQYGRDARRCIAEIRQRGKRVLVAGGSGLYVRGLVDGFFEPKVADAEVKARLKREAHERGIAELYERLESVDPVTAGRLHATDFQRILRALEVYEITDKPFSEFLDIEPQPADFPTVFLGLTMDRGRLYERIEQRVDAMLDAGLLQEVRQLQKMGYNRDLNALQTVGYQEAFAYLTGDLSYEYMVSRIKQKTRNYAKRQMTWFRKDERIQWFDVGEFADRGKLVAAIEKVYLSGETPLR